MTTEQMLVWGALLAPWVCFFGSTFVAWLEADDRALRIAMTINAVLSLPIGIAALIVIVPMLGDY